MQFRAIVPPGDKPNHTIRVTAEGRQLNVRIPKSMKDGEIFIFEVDLDVLKKCPPQEEVPVQDETQLIVVEGSLAPPLPPINPYTEFATAICLGVLVGLSIVLGFILAILYTVEPMPVRVPAAMIQKAAQKRARTTSVRVEVSPVQRVAP